MKCFILFILLFFCTFSCQTVERSANKSQEQYKDDGKDGSYDRTTSNTTKNQSKLYRVLAESYYSPFAHSSKEVYIARSLAEAIAISEGNENIVSLCEGVDFKKEAILFAFAGSFNTGGYRVNIDSVEKQSRKKVKVIFSVSSPGMGAIVTQAFTHPSLIVAISANSEDTIEASFRY